VDGSAIACDNSGQNVYVAWMDQRDTLHGWDVYFSRSTDYGQTFEPNYPINDTATTGNTPQDYPSIYYKNNIIYVVWHDGRDPSGGYFARSIDNGVSFGPNVRVTDDPWATGMYSSITADDSANVYIVWRDYRDYSTYGHDIYFAFSSDSGQTFNGNVLVNDHQGIENAWDWDPSICVNDSGKVFAAWSSTRNDPSFTNFDIYCASGNYVGIEEYHNPQTSLAFQCYPNPFIRMTNLICGIGHGAEKNPVSVSIYDASGRMVKSFTLNPLHSAFSITWHGDDDYGQEVPEGVYFIQFLCNGHKSTEKIVKIK